MKKKSVENIHVCGVGEVLSDQELSYLSGGKPPTGCCAGGSCQCAGDFEASFEAAIEWLEGRLK